MQLLGSIDALQGTKLDIATIRQSAKKYGAEEIHFDSYISLIAFKLRSSSIALHIYYATGTILMIDSESGRSKFQSDQTINNIITILKSSGNYSLNYAKLGRGTATYSDEATALGEQLQVVKTILGELSQEQTKVENMLIALNERRRELELIHTQKQAVIAQEMYQKRGNYWAALLDSHRQDNLSIVVGQMANHLVSCVAMSISSVIMIYDDGNVMWTPDVPVAVQNSIHSRPPSAPRPSFIAMNASNNTDFFIRYQDNKADWNCGNPDFDSFVRDTTIDKVAFGYNHSWFAITKHGDWGYANVPEKLLIDLLSIENKSRVVEVVSLGLENEYFVSFSDGHWVCGELSLSLNADVMKRTRELVHVYLGGNGAGSKLECDSGMESYIIRHR